MHHLRLLASRLGKVKVTLHGEAEDLTSEQIEEKMAKWLPDFHEKLERRNIKPACLYNADQTGLYYQKLPNTMYVDIEAKKEARGCKQMKDKTRITLMICTAANGDKLPIAVVGKSACPKCFKNKDVPLPYTNQKNSWFDKNITKWWLNNCLIPYHYKTHGKGVPCCVLLDNCSAHKLSDAEFAVYREQKIYIEFLPPNLTSQYQPADMGMIAALKVGYKTIMLTKLLSIFDEDGGYQSAFERRKKQPPGCKGIDFGGKATILDAIEIIHDIWSKDDKYASNDGIKRCWRKADILPPTWQTDINNDVGSKSLATRHKTLSGIECSELCKLLKKITINARESQLDMRREGYVLEGSFASDPDVNDLLDTQWKEMATNWICIEEDIDVVEEEISEVIEDIDSNVDRALIALDDDEEDCAYDPAIYDPVMLMETETEPITTSQALEYMDGLRQYCVQRGFEEELRKLSLIESSMRKKRKEQATVNPTITSFFQKKMLTK